MLKHLQAAILLLMSYSVGASPQLQNIKHPIIDNTLHAIEREYHLKIGVYALDTNNDQIIAYHANDRFPFQSTCKFMGVSALLAKDTDWKEQNKNPATIKKDGFVQLPAAQLQNQ